MATTTLIIAVALVIVVYFIIKTAKTLVRLLLLAVVVALGVYFWKGGDWKSLEKAGIEELLGETTLTGLKERFCSGLGYDVVKCQCIALPIHQDINSRLSAEQIAEIDKTKSKIQEELKRSLNNRKQVITDCLIDKKGSEYIRQIISITQKATEKTKDMLEEKAGE